MKILLAGGGSGGPVVPLLAIAQEIKNQHPKAEFLLVGTSKGPERRLAQKTNMAFTAITAAKLRRYFSLYNFLLPFLLVLSFFQAIKILKVFKPNCVVGAGGFVQVPVAWAAWFLKIPVLLHQQDVVPSLANKLCQLVAKKITVSLEVSLKDFTGFWPVFYKKIRSEKVIYTGNPVREFNVEKKPEALKTFGLSDELPTLLVLGGGQGSEFLNNLVIKALPALTKIVQVLHSTGKQNLENFPKHKNYFPVSFLDNMGEAYTASDMVLSRAGVSTIAELSFFSKVSIIIPLLDTHQEDNGDYLDFYHAAVVMRQNIALPELLTQVIRRLLFKHELQKTLKTNIHKLMPHNSSTLVAKEVIKLSIHD